ncbi:MAG: hypothetical protein HPY50_19115 [Firmicutes bacterium]|nr:hypothetical protein [Bacillota bacterium]
MRYKKMVALFLILVFTAAIIAGCSPVERGFYELVKEVSNSNSYEFKGSMEVTVEQLPQGAFKGSPAITEDVFKQMVNNNRLEYQGRVDYNQGVLLYQFTLVDKTTNAQTALTTVILKDNKIYLKVDDLINYIGKWSSGEEKQKLDEVFKGVEYLCISSQEIQEQIKLPPGSPSLWGNNILRESKETHSLYMSLYDKLVYDAYGKYSGNLITKDGNRYKVSLRFADAGKAFEPLAVYTINNIYQVGTVLKSFFSGLSDNELERLKLSREVNESIVSGIDDMIDDVELNRTDYLDKLGKGVDEVNAELAKNLGDSGFEMTLEKKDSRTYESSAKINLNLTDMSDSLKLVLSTQDSSTVGVDVKVEAPSNFITYSELKQRMPVKLSFNIDEGNYSQEGLFGKDTLPFSGVKVINGKSYLPLRKTADLLGLRVGWNSTLEKAYIEINGEHRYVEGELVDGVTYIKAIEFGQLGYSVSWDETARAVVIQKN